MTETHIITSGSYSDYKIVGVFADKDEAERVCQQHNEGRYDPEDWRVESFPLIEGEQTPAEVLFMSCDFQYNRPEFYGGDLRESGERFSINFPFEDEKVGVCEKQEESGTSWFRVSVRGTDIERVRKVYSELKAEWLAKYQGIA